MPTSWNNWYHITGTTYGAWLPGDPRGWRSRHHKHHCQGDYKSPPPEGKYIPQHNYSKFIMTKDAIILTWQQRLLAAKIMSQSLLDRNVELIELCLSPTHFHILCRFTPIKKESPGIAIPGSNLSNKSKSKNRSPRHLIGLAKKDAARLLSTTGLTRPGRLWATRSKPTPIRNRQRQLRTARYIRAHTKRGAAVYTIHIKPLLTPLPIPIKKRKPMDRNPWVYALPTTKNPRNPHNPNTPSRLHTNYVDNL